MKNACFVTVLFLGYVFASFAQDAATTTTTNPATSIMVARTGIRTDGPHVGTYHYTEFFQVRDRWIYPDFGVVDFGHGNYREVFVGAGRTLYGGKRIAVTEELYLAQATGSAAKNARYLWPWTLVDIKLTPKLNAEIVYFPYLPINKSAQIQHVVERAKVEYPINRIFKVGGGYSGYKCGDGDWLNKPFATTTALTRVGIFEFWLQKMPGGAQVQIRYKLVRSPR